MTSFTSSFNLTVFGRETRKRYGIVGASLMVVVLMTSFCCQLWINGTTQGAVSASRELGPSTELIIAGSSHLLGQNSTTINPNTVNLSHAANSLRMIDLTVQSAIPRVPNVRCVVIELGHVVLTSDPTRLRGHAFVELGVAPWRIPGTTSEKIGRLTHYFPPVRVPRLTPQNVLVALRPDLNAEAQGLKVKQIGDFVENSAFRAEGIHFAMETATSTIEDNFAALEELLHVLAQKNIRVVIVLTPHTLQYREAMYDHERALLDKAKRICSGYAQVSILDLYAAESNGFERDMFADCDHLNTSGHRRLGELISRTIADDKTTPRTDQVSSSPEVSLQTAGKQR